ncbi:MAG: hypothetical protein H7123_01390 [Thermoleophilia bacterium]|nr:hypothetical protein [Thermoleophilia bacterium]
MQIASPYTAQLPEPAPIVTQHGDLHDVTPTGRPSWYGREVGVENRSPFSHTGDVTLLAGNTFGIHFATAGAAINRAQEASRGGQGAVLVMATPHNAATDAATAGVQTAAAAFVAHAIDANTPKTDYSLVRAYNVEFRKGDGYVVERSTIDGRQVKNFHAEVQYLVEGDTVVTAAR